MNFDYTIPELVKLSNKNYYAIHNTLVYYSKLETPEEKRVSRKWCEIKKRHIYSVPAIIMSSKLGISLTISDNKPFSEAELMVKQSNVKAASSVGKAPFRRHGDCDGCEERKKALEDELNILNNNSQAARLELDKTNHDVRVKEDMLLGMKIAKAQNK